jgi:hypothetical protein
MQKIFWTAATLMTLIVWTACSKHNSDNNNNNNSQMTLMTQAVWRYDTSGIDLNKDGQIDLPDTLEACYKDNTYQFKTDSTAVVDEGALKCDGSAPQTATYSWTISKDNPPVIKTDADPILASGIKVKELTSSKLIVYKDTAIQGVGIWFILSLKH